MPSLPAYQVKGELITKRKTNTTNQYGVPMNDFLLAKVAVIWADTPKSATERKGRKRIVKRNENNRG